MKNHAENFKEAPQAARTIQIKGISGSLICNSNILASLSRISSPVSPVFTSSPESSIRKANLESEQNNDGVDRSRSVRKPEELQESSNCLRSSSSSADTNLLSTSSKAQFAVPSRLDESVLTNDNDRFADADIDIFTQNNASEQV